MNDLRERWIAALRSGKYEQGRQYLNNERGFCCLGVLADIAGADWVQGDGAKHLVHDGAYYRCGLPHCVLDEDAQGELWRRNDGCSGYRSHTFPQIADYIEAHPEIDPKWPPEGK